MDIVPSIWLSSFAGAAFFYAGGRIWPPRKGPVLGAPEAPSRAEAELEGARAAIAFAETDAAAAREAQEQAARALAEERARAQALEQQMAAERAAWTQARREAEGQLRALGADAARLAEEKKGLSEEKTALAGEKARLAEEKARIGAQAAEVALQLAELRAKGATEIGKTRARLSAAEARAAEAEKKAAGSTAVLKAKLDETTREISRARVEAAVESRQREASLAEELDRGKRELCAANARAKELGGRLAEAEARAAEADRLRATSAGLLEAATEARATDQRAGLIARKDQEIAELARRVEALSAAARDAEELRQKVRDLSAKNFAREAMESIPELPPSERWTEGEALETTLEAALAEVVEHEGGCRTAVLSDARGLLIAAAGTDGSHEEIAAAAALATMAAERLRDLIPVGQPMSMAVLDDNQVVFRTRWLRYGDECFLLSTLGVRTRPLEQGADTLRARLTTLVFG